MMKAVITLFLISLVVFASAHRHHGHHGHHESSQCSRVCHFTIDKDEYNLKGLDREIVISDASTSSTIKFSPCGVVNDEACPSGSSVCMIVKEGTGINFGYSKTLLFNKVPFEANQVEAIEGMYGNGELCNNGSPRKTIVQYVCDLTVTGKESILSSSVEDECTLYITMSSPLACPVSEYCASLDSKDDCEEIKNTCFWDVRNRNCIAASEGEAYSVHASLFSIVGLGAFTLLLLSCSICLCCVALKKRRSRRRLTRRAALARKSGKSTKKSASSTATTTSSKSQIPKYQPLGNVQHIQLVPGNFVPVNGPYSENHFPMYPIVVQQPPVNQ